MNQLEHIRSPWLHGIQHLTMDAQGYVYWKARHIEHYSFRSDDKEREAARELAARCLELETMGISPTLGTAVLFSEWFQKSTSWTPALKALQRDLYANDAGVVAIVGHPEDIGSDTFVVGYFDNGKLVSSDKCDRQDLIPYHYLSGKGFHTPNIGQGRHSGICYSTQEQAEAFLAKCGFTPDSLIEGLSQIDFQASAFLQELGLCA